MEVHKRVFGQVGPNRCVEANHEGTGGGVIRERLPANNGEIWDSCDDTLGQGDGVTAVEHDASEL